MCLLYTYTNIENYYIIILLEQSRPIKIQISIKDNGSR